MRNLTPEELTLVPAYIEKWKAIALSTERVNRQAVVETLRFLYERWDTKPEIRFFDSPYALLKSLSSELPKNWDCYGEISFIPSDEFEAEELLAPVDVDLITPLGEFLNSLWRPVLDVMFKLPDIPREIASNYCHDQVPQSDLVYVCEYDYYHTVLGYSLSDTEQLVRQMVQTLLSSCGWMFPLYQAWDENDKEIEDGEDFCWICDRPVKILLDSENRLHAENEPAIEYADGFSVWAQHGVLVIP